MTSGFVARDLVFLCRNAILNSLRKQPKANLKYKTNSISIQFYFYFFKKNF